jgi:23S rRNA pseudouridine2605 synthase
MAKQRNNSDRSDSSGNDKPRRSGNENRRGSAGSRSNASGDNSRSGKRDAEGNERRPRSGSGNPSGDRRSDGPARGGRSERSDRESKPRSSGNSTRGGARSGRPEGGSDRHPASRGTGSRSESTGSRVRRAFSEGESDRPKRRPASDSYKSDGPKRRPSFGSGGERPKRRPASDSYKSDGPKRRPSFSSDEDRPKRRTSSDSYKTDGPKRRPSFGSNEDRPKRRTSLDSYKSDGPKRRPSFGSDEDRPKRRTSSDGYKVAPYAKRSSAGSGEKKAAGAAKDDSGMVRLNRFIANSGKCSRREADEFIRAGAVKVNGVVVTELGTKVSYADVIQFGDEKLSGERPVYVLLNKPKDYITTTEDTHGRRTVMMLVAKACRERIYPVGRLDRNTTGVLLFTNDGEMARKLTHPSSRIPKIYQVDTDKNVKREDLDRLLNGIELEDGVAVADEVSYVGASKRTVGIKIHSGRNRIVRRMFEAMGYDVIRLDRVIFAGLTKKDLPRGRYRHLSEKEVSMLKML